jgi:hypothetical protein
MTGAPAVFFVPHQDDETLSMSVQILRHVEAGREVHVVFLSDGQASRIYEVLTGAAVCTWHDRVHDPAAEGYSGLTRTQFGYARDKEARIACTKLGVPVSCIHQERLPVVDVSTATQVMLKYAHLLGPGSTAFTMSPWESESGAGATEHGDLGIALRALAETGGVEAACRYQVFSHYYDSPLWPDYAMRNTATTAQRPLIDAAAGPYKYWDPAGGRFAIGYHSVRPAFTRLQSGPLAYTNFVHR